MWIPFAKFTLMSRKRIVIPGVVHHIYQRTRPGKLIFYSARDAIVYFTLAMVLRDKYGIRTVGICIMPDHIHHLEVPSYATGLSGYHRELNGRFVREFNSDCGRKGPLFDPLEPFGSAPKFSDKSIRTCIAYLANNAPERRLCLKAEQYRWNFLAYYHDKYPFSSPIVLRRASYKLRRSLKEVELLQCRHRYLGYRNIDRLFSSLAQEEKSQLLDHIIFTYNEVDLDYAVSFYNSYEAMLTAVNSNTGSEHDILEERGRGSDAVYRQMCSAATGSGMVLRPKDVIVLPLGSKLDLARIIARRTGPDIWHLSRFLHVEEDTLRQALFV